MSKSSAKSARNRLRLNVESLEQRLNLSLPTPLSLVNLPGASNPGWQYSAGTFLSSAVAADINGTGKQDLLAVGGDSKIYAYRYDSGSNNLVVDRTFDPGAGEQIDSTPAFVNLPGGPAIFAASNTGRIFGWNAATGSTLPGWPQQQSVFFGAIRSNPNSIYGAIAAGDLDGDGIPEIVVTSRNFTVTAFHANGAFMWQFNNDDTVFTAPVIADLNGDGKPEVIFGGDSSHGDFYDNGGRIVCLSADGRRVWVKATDQVIQGSPVVADLYGNGQLSVIASTGPFYAGKGNKVYALDANGNDLPGWPYQTADPAVIQAGSYTSPVVADLLGNGQLEVIYADGVGKIHAIKPDGTALWVAQPANFAGQILIATPIVADINGDGQQDVVINNGPEIYAFNGSNGREIWHATLNGEFNFSSPAVANLKGDGFHQIAFVGIAVSSTGVKLSPSYLRTYNLDPAGAPPAWGAYRQDASNSALHRSDAVMANLISQLWTNTLARPALAESYNYWLPIFRESPTLQPSIAGITGSQEARTLRINNYYTKYLGRSVEEGGRLNWLSFLNSGQNDIFIQAYIVGSLELYNASGATPQGWVTQLYQLVLGRVPQGGEDSGWVTFVTANPSARGQVALGFLNSQELTEQTVRSWYRTYTPGGLNVPRDEDLRGASWDLRRGITVEPVLANILSSRGDYLNAQPEGSWLRGMYRDVLGREAAPSDLIAWLTSFEQGSTFSTASQAIINSSEFHDGKVAEYYQKYLGRATTQAERLPLVTAWNSKTLNGPGIQAQMIASNEYYALAGSTPTGFVNKVYQDLLQHAPDAASLNFYVNTAIATVRPTLGPFLLKTPEYGFLLTRSLFYRDLRRFSYTPLDSSAVLPAGASSTEGAQPFMDLISRGGTAEDILQTILISPEYFGMVRQKAFWGGSRWKISFQV